MFDTLTLNPTINPFFAGRMSYERPRVYAKLPVAPLNTSPVPHLTSLYHDDEAGDYGDRSYPGNCGGNLIRDLLKFYQPRNVFDPLCGASHKGSCVVMPIMWPCSDLLRNSRRIVISIQHKRRRLLYFWLTALRVLDCHVSFGHVRIRRDL